MSTSVFLLLRLPQMLKCYSAGETNSDISLMALSGTLPALLTGYVNWSCQLLYQAKALFAFTYLQQWWLCLAFQAKYCVFSIGFIVFGFLKANEKVVLVVMIVAFSHSHEFFCSIVFVSFHPHVAHLKHSLLKCAPRVIHNTFFSFFLSFKWIKLETLAPYCRETITDEIMTIAPVGLQSYKLCSPKTAWLNCVILQVRSSICTSVCYLSLLVRDVRLYYDWEGWYCWKWRMHC